MKKITILLFCGLLLTACGQKNDLKTNLESEKKAINNNSDTAVVVNQQFFESLQEIQLFKEANYKTDSIVRIPVGQNHKTFIGKPNSEMEIADYNYIGSLRTTGFHLVTAHYWEHYETYLIDRSSGHIDTLWGSHPVINVGEDLLIAKSMDFGLEGVPNGYQIWKMGNKRKWTKIKEIDQLDWIPIEVRLSNTHPAFYVVKRIPVNQMEAENPDYEYVKYKIN